MSVLFLLRDGPRQRTKSRIHSWLGATGFSDHDRGVRVVLLHGRVASREEIPVHPVSLVFLRPSCIPTAPTCGVKCVVAECDMPRRSAVLAGLAKQEPQLLQALAKDIF